jgi:hypothetical protein
LVSKQTQNRFWTDQNDSPQECFISRGRGLPPLTIQSQVLCQAKFVSDQRISTLFIILIGMPGVVTEVEQCFSTNGALIFEIAPKKGGHRKLLVYASFDYKKRRKVLGRRFVHTKTRVSGVRP